MSNPTDASIATDARVDAGALRREIERELEAAAVDEEASARFGAAELHADRAASRSVELLIMLERLQQMAQEGSDDRRFADRQLAELLLESDPWRAAVHVRRLLAHDAADGALWALMGLAQALLRHHRFSAHAYRQALARDPGNPWYAHNLGHVVDVALDRPRDALALLLRSHRALPTSVPVACSYAHALWRSGEVTAARTVLAPILAEGGGVEPDVAALAAELMRSERRRRARAARGDEIDALSGVGERSSSQSDARAWAADLVARCATELARRVERGRLPRVHARRILKIVERFAALTGDASATRARRSPGTTDVLAAAAAVLEFASGGALDRAIETATATETARRRAAPLAREMIARLSVRSRAPRTSPAPRVKKR